LLKTAKPAADAGLRTVLRSHDLPQLLPASLGPQVSPEDIAQRAAAASRGLSWSEVAPNLLIESQSNESATVKDGDAHTRIDELAVADFNDDRGQDVLARTTSYAEGATWFSIDLWLLTSQNATRRLVVLEHIKL